MDKSEKNLAIFHNFESCHLNKFLKKIWPFIIFEALAFLKLRMAKFGRFNFSGPGIPENRERGRNGERLVDISVQCQDSRGKGKNLNERQRMEKNNNSTSSKKFQQNFNNNKFINLDQRCPTHSPLATCGEWPIECGEWIFC